MKKIFVPILIILCSAAVNAQNNPEEIWEGKLNVNSFSLRIVFNITKIKIGEYKVTMDSPDQGAKGIPCSNAVVKEDSILIESKLIAGKYAGKFKNNSLIKGIWTQLGKTYPLELKHVNAVTEINHYQTPKPPFSYHSDSVEYDNADKSVHYGATFTYPSTNKTYPTAVLITGSGQQDRDETLMGHKPFAVIADYLTKKGIAVLRIDDRGIGKTTGSLKNVTSEDFAKDIEVALDFLKTRKEVNQQKIGLIGHSEGGLIASIIAARNSNINFVIMLAGPGLIGKELLAEQGEAILVKNKLHPREAAAGKILSRKIYDDILSSNDTALIVNKCLDDLNNWEKTESKFTVRDLGYNDTDTLKNKQKIREQVFNLNKAWFRYFLSTNPCDFIEKFSCKVLALNGGEDIQVVPQKNIAAIEKALKKSKSPSYETIILPGLNHLFQHCKKCTISEYSELEETFATEALEIMNSWLQKNIIEMQ